MASSPSQLSSIVLVKRARARDADAIAMLYERYRERLRVALRKKLGSAYQKARVDSEDVVQDGILAALQRIDSFEYQGQGSFLAWLLRVSERELLMRLRAQGAKRRDAGRERPLDEALDLAGAEASPSQVAAGRETEAQVERALDSLAAQERDVIVLRRYLGLDSKEIAEELSLVSAGAVRALLSRAQAKLALALELADPQADEACDEG